MNNTLVNDVRAHRRSLRAVIPRLVIAACFTAVFPSAIAQTPNDKFADEHADMMNALLGEGPNSAPTMHLRIVGFAAQGAGGEFSIPVKISEEQCTSAKCEISSRLDDGTEIINGEGENVDAQSLKTHHTYKAISIRFDDRGPGLVEQIMLMPKRSNTEK